MIKVVVVYNLVPDSLKIYQFEVNGEEFEKLQVCHGKYGNFMDYNLATNEILEEWLPKFLEGKKIIYADDGDFTTIHQLDGILIVTGCLC